jgi:hypothetical protein
MIQKRQRLINLAAFGVAEANEVVPNGLPNQRVIVKAVHKQTRPVTYGMLPQSDTRLKILSHEWKVYAGSARW